MGEDDVHRQSSSKLTGFDTMVHKSIDHICSELNLDQFVRSRCFELLNYLKPASSQDKTDNIPESVAHAVACALISMAHEEAFKMHRAPRHLPDRIIGKLYGIRGSVIVYNKHLISSVITKKKVSGQKDAGIKIRTLR